MNGTDPAAITGYQYRRAESNAGLASAVWNSAGNTTAFIVTDLTGGTTYHFQVRALNGVTPGGAASNVDSATTRALSSDANLSALVISLGTLSPEFVAAKTAYTDRRRQQRGNPWPSLQRQRTVVRTIAVNDSTVTSGSASGAIATRRSEPMSIEVSRNRRRRDEEDVYHHRDARRAVHLHRRR